jgi:molybdopterin/thiamine biosynthesis adenylyltransferase
VAQHDHSRPLRLGSRAAGVPEDTLRQRLEHSTVVVSVDPSLPGALLTARVLAMTLRRLPIDLVLEPARLSEDLVEEIRAGVVRIDSRRGLMLADGLATEVIRVHVGARTGDAGAIRVAPDGYGVHIARDAGVELHIARRAHPLGSVFTAAMAAGEVFKDLAGVLDRRRVDHSHLTWCPVSLSADLTVAPMQSTPLELRLALAGCGAIGTAIALILQELDATGDLLVIDRQRFARENLSTYSLGDEASVRGLPWKVNLVRRHLQRYRVRTLNANVEDLASMVDRGEVVWPRVVLAGLDSAAARRGLQRLWPDRLIDGGTSDTAVGLHDVVADDGPCLMCFFPPRSEDDTVRKLARLTGLSIDRLGHGDDPLLANELQGKTPEQEALLKPMLGKPVCGLARAAGLVESDADGYQPVVPFVAQQAACLVVGRLIADQMGVRSAGNFVEYDALIGPRVDGVDRRRTVSGCHCQERADVIRKVRAARRGTSSSG